MSGRNQISQELGTGIEALRGDDLAVSHGVSGAQLAYGAVGPWDVDFDVNSLVVTPTVKPAANASNKLDVWVGAPGTVSDVQTITVTATGGTFKVGFGGVWTAAQAFNVSTANLQTALRGLSTIGGSNVTVAGTPGSSYAITFAANLANELMPLAQVDPAALTDGSATIAHTTPGVGQRLIATQVDAAWTAHTPVSAVIAPAPPAAPRLPAGKQITLAVSYNGDDSAAPTSFCVHANLEVPLFDQTAKRTSFGIYDRNS